MPSAPPENPASLDRAALTKALLRVANQDRAALQEVYSRTSRKLFGICLRIFPERADAEDALQEVYLAVWRHAGSFNPERGSPISWLATLARNRSIEVLRRSGRRPTAPLELADDIADDTPDAEAALIASDEDGRIGQCIETLASSDAVMIRAAFFDGSTYADLATRAQIPLGTVKSRIRRALLRLRGCLA